MPTNFTSNVQTPNVSQASIQPSASLAPTPNPTSKLREILAKILSGLSNIRGKFSTQAEPIDGGIVAAPGISSKTKRIITIVAALFLTVITLLIVVTYLKSREKKPKVEEAQQPSAQTTIVERKLSRYATDEAVLKMETDIKALDTSINKEDIEEKALTPPTLNFDVNFKE